MNHATHAAMNRAELIWHVAGPHRMQGDFQTWTTQELEVTHNMVHDADVVFDYDLKPAG